MPSDSATTPPKRLVFGPHLTDTFVPPAERKTWRLEKPSTKRRRRWRSATCTPPHLGRPRRPGAPRRRPRPRARPDAAPSPRRRPETKHRPACFSSTTPRWGLHTGCSSTQTSSTSPSKTRRARTQRQPFPAPPSRAPPPPCPRPARPPQPAPAPPPAISPNHFPPPQLDLVQGMMDCLYAECTPCITDCVMAELEKLGTKYRVSLRVRCSPSSGGGGVRRRRQVRSGRGLFSRRAAPERTPRPRGRRGARATARGPKTQALKPQTSPKNSNPGGEGPAHRAAAVHALRHVRR